MSTPNLNFEPHEWRADVGAWTLVIARSYLKDGYVWCVYRILANGDLNAEPEAKGFCSHRGDAQTFAVAAAVHLDRLEELQAGVLPQNSKDKKS